MSRRKVTDWREAARGIPVWEGAAAWFEGKRWRVTRLWPSVDGGEDRVSLDALDGSGDGEIPPVQTVVPDLTDPDTRAAYDRRLALALGAPTSAVEEGAHFGYDSVREEWRISRAAPGSACASSGATAA